VWGSSTLVGLLLHAETMQCNNDERELLLLICRLLAPRWCECWKHGSKAKAKNGGNPFLSHKIPYQPHMTPSPPARERERESSFPDIVPREN